MEISNSSNKKSNPIKLVGTYNLNSTILEFEATDISNQFKLNSSINILESFKKRLDSDFKATFLSSDLNLDRKSLIDLSEIFKNIQNILIDLNSGVKLNNKIQIKSLLSNLN